MEKGIRFLPCLEQRLMDDEPKKQKEMWDKYNFNSHQMRAIIQASLTEILNNTNIEDSLHPQRHKQVTNSVLNYGISPVSGTFSSPHSWSLLEQCIRKALIRFEPRLIAESIVINPLGDRERPNQKGCIYYEICALVHWKPEPLDLYFKANYDLESSYTVLTK